MALSTNSSPRTLLRILRPRSYVALSMMISNVCGCREALVLGPERLRQRQLRRKYRDRNAGLPLHDRHAGADTPALFIELDLAQRIIFLRTSVHRTQIL